MDHSIVPTHNKPFRRLSKSFENLLLIDSEREGLPLSRSHSRSSAAASQREGDPASDYSQFVDLPNGGALSLQIVSVERDPEASRERETESSFVIPEFLQHASQCFSEGQEFFERSLFQHAKNKFFDTLVHLARGDDFPRCLSLLNGVCPCPSLSLSLFPSHRETELATGTAASERAQEAVRYVDFKCSQCPIECRSPHALSLVFSTQERDAETEPFIMAPGAHRIAMEQQEEDDVEVRKRDESSAVKTEREREAAAGLSLSLPHIPYVCVQSVVYALLSDALSALSLCLDRLDEREDRQAVSHASRRLRQVLHGGDETLRCDLSVRDLPRFFESDALLEDRLSSMTLRGSDSLDARAEGRERDAQERREGAAEIEWVRQEESARQEDERAEQDQLTRCGSTEDERRCRREERVAQRAMEREQDRAQFLSSFADLLEERERASDEAIESDVVQQYCDLSPSEDSYTLEETQEFNVC